MLKFNGPPLARLASAKCPHGQYDSYWHILVLETASEKVRAIVVEGVIAIAAAIVIMVIVVFVIVTVALTYQEILVRQCYFQQHQELLKFLPAWSQVVIPLIAVLFQCDVALALVKRP